MCPCDSGPCGATRLCNSGSMSHSDDVRYWSSGCTQRTELPQSQTPIDHLRLKASGPVVQHRSSIERITSDRRPVSRCGVAESWRIHHYVLLAASLLHPTLRWRTANLRQSYIPLSGSAAPFAANRTTANGVPKRFPALLLESTLAPMHDFRTIVRKQCIHGEQTANAPQPDHMDHASEGPQARPHHPQTRSMLKGGLMERTLFPLASALSLPPAPLERNSILNLTNWSG